MSQFKLTCPCDDLQLHATESRSLWPLVALVGDGDAAADAGAIEVPVEEAMAQNKNGKSPSLSPLLAEEALDQQGMVERMQRLEAELHRTQEALRASQANSLAVLNASRGSLFRFNPHGICLEVVAVEGLQALVASTEIVGKHATELFTPAMAQSHLQAMERILRTGQPQAYACRLQVNGDWRDYEARSAPGPAGEIVTVLRDVTEQVRVQEQLKRNNARLTTLQQINAIIHSGLPLNRVLRLIVENIRQGLGYRGVIICLPDESRRELTIRAAAGQLDRSLCRHGDTPTRRIAFSYDQGDNPLVAAYSQQHFQQVAAEAWLVALCDAGASEMAEALETLEVTYGVALPLWHADQGNVIIGILGVLKHGQEAFTRDELQLLSSVAGQAALAVHSVRLFQAEQQRRREMEALYQAGLAITSQPGPAVLRGIIQQIVDLLGVEGCGICRWDPGADVLVTELFLDRHADEWQERARPGTYVRLAERPTLRRVLAEQVVVSLQGDGERVDLAERTWMAQAGIKSRLVLPLVVGEHSIGLLELTESRWQRAFTDHDLRIARGLAAQAAVAMQTTRLYQEKLMRIQSELELAQRIQASLLPQQPPLALGLEVAARSLPARQVGGDFYRYLTLPDGRFGLVLGDVSGKGVPGALFMAMTITALDAQAHACSTPADWLSRLNQVLYPRMQTSHMNTGVLVAIFEPGGTRMQVSNAGMLHPLVVSDHTAYWLDVSGLPIGSFPSIQYTGQDVELGDGAVIVFVSDGIVEAMNTDGELFGFERLQTVVESMRADDPETVLEGIWQAVSAHIGDAEVHDDMTLVVVRARG